MAFFFHGGARTRPERPPQDSPGQRPGFAATVAIKRCKRATILLLTQRHSNVVAQTSKSAVSQHLSRSLNSKSMASFFQHGGANTRPERPPHDSPGQRPGFAATVAIKRCKRATILLLTRRHPNVVAQASQPAVGKLVRRFPNLRAVSFQSRIRTCLRSSFHGVFHVSLSNGYEISGLGLAILLPASISRPTFVFVCFVCFVVIHFGIRVKAPGSSHGSLLFPVESGYDHSLTGWSRGAHAPSRAAVDASSTAPTRASARGPAWPGTRDFGISPANRRRPDFQVGCIATPEPFRQW